MKSLVLFHLNTNLSTAERNEYVISKAIVNYVYTIENNGFVDYRIIGEHAIDVEELD